MKRDSIYFLVRFCDYSERWIPYSDNIARTNHFEQYISSKAALTPLLYSRREVAFWRKKINATKITEVKCGDVVYVDLRSYGSEWFNNRNLPEAYKDYVVNYEYVRPLRGGKLFMIKCPLFNEEFPVDHEFVLRYGSVFTFDPDSMVLVDSELLEQFPGIIADI